MELTNTAKSSTVEAKKVFLAGTISAANIRNNFNYRNRNRKLVDALAERNAI